MSEPVRLRGKIYFTKYILCSVVKNAQVKTIYDDKNAEEKTKPGLRKRGDGSRDSK